jgi:hypothetical protein
MRTEIDSSHCENVFLRCHSLDLRAYEDRFAQAARMEDRFKNPQVHSKSRDTLERELERAMAAKLRLEEEHTVQLRHVARSPKKLPRPSPSKPQPPVSSSAAANRSRKVLPAKGIRAYRPIPVHAENAGTQPCNVTEPSSPPPATAAAAAATATATRGQKIKEEVGAAAGRNIQHVQGIPLSIEEAVNHRHVANNSFSSEDEVICEEERIEPVADQVTPFFMTAKRRNMHCELDTPGVNVPFYHHDKASHRQARRGFFARLLSCFAPPPTATAHISATHSRPGSGNSVSNMITPPRLTLKREMAPLRQSLVSLKQEANGNQIEEEHVKEDGDVLGKLGKEETALLRHSLARRAAARVADNPPTPRFGGMPVMPVANRITTGQIDSVQHRMLKSPSEASYLSLEAEASVLGLEEETPEGGRSLRRTPMAGSGGIPRLRRRHSSHDIDTEKKQPGSVKQPKGQGMKNGETTFSWLADIPLPPQMPQDPSNITLSEARQTSVSLNTLLTSPQLAKDRNISDRMTTRISSAPSSPGRMVGPLGAAARSAPVSRASSPARKLPQEAQQQQGYPRTTMATEKRRAATQRLLAARKQREAEQLTGWSRRKPVGKSVGAYKATVGLGGAHKGSKQTREHPSTGHGAQDQAASPGYCDMLDKLALGLSVDASRVKRAKRLRDIEGGDVGHPVPPAKCGTDELVGKIKDLERSLTLEDLEALRTKLAA